MGMEKGVMELFLILAQSFTECVVFGKTVFIS